MFISCTVLLCRFGEEGAAALKDELIAAEEYEPNEALPDRTDLYTYTVPAGTKKELIGINSRTTGQARTILAISYSTDNSSFRLDLVLGCFARRPKYITADTIIYKCMPENDSII